jgi:hypothetical protein
MAPASLMGNNKRPVDVWSTGRLLLLFASDEQSGDCSTLQVA